MCWRRGKPRALPSMGLTTNAKTSRCGGVAGGLRLSGCPQVGSCSQLNPDPGSDRSVGVHLPCVLQKLQAPSLGKAPPAQG